MKTIASRRFRAMFIACLLPAVAAAEADGPDYFRVTGVGAEDVLNIRAEPSAASPKTGEIPPDADCIRNLGCRGGLSFEEFTTLTKSQQAERLRDNPRWCSIKYQEVIGWVAGRYLTEGSCTK